MPLFVVQVIFDCNTPKEMKMYTEQTGIETVQGTKKILKSFFYPVKSVYVLRLTEVHLLVEYD